jgi:hypothetical protein
VVQRGSPTTAALPTRIGGATPTRVGGGGGGLPNGGLASETGGPLLVVAGLGLLGLVVIGARRPRSR